jgi:NAD(P)-dependent dehydrogenase (short-subunit alcohol dehydrogenase family)
VIAVGLAKQGAIVVIGDVGDLTETSDLIAKFGNPAMAAPLDISSPAVIDRVRERVADELGKVDILVNNAAIFESATWVISQQSPSQARYPSHTEQARWQLSG